MAERHNKYGAVQTIGDDGQRYDSGLEAHCARVLDLLARQGRIRAYLRQAKFQLAPKRPERGLREACYVVDFFVHAGAPGGRDQHSLALEVKGCPTAVGRLKMRWFAEAFPAIPLRVVRAPEEVIAVIEELERADAAARKETMHAQHTEPDCD